MRLALVLAAVIALVAALYFALSTDPASPGLEPTPVAPERADAPPPTVELAQSERSSVSLAPRRSAPDPSGSASATRASIAIVVVDKEGRKLGSGVEVECRDALARLLVLEAGPGLVFRARDVPPGEHTVSIVAPASIPAVERIAVLAVAEEQRFEMRVEAAPRVRVRWQADDGRPILDALESPQILPGPSLLCVAVDSAIRGLGDPALKCRRSAFFGTGIGEGPPRATWPGAPPDALCEIALASATPAVLTASIDGTIVASETVEDAAREVVFRTPLALLRQMRASVRFCLVDGATGAPVVDASFSGRPREGVQWSTGVGPSGCAEHQFTPGRTLIEFRAPGRASLFREVDLQPGAELDLGVLQFTAPGHVTIRARHADGSAASAVRLALFPADRLAWGQRAEVSTGPDGVARFADLPLEPHVLVVADPRHACRPLRVEPSTPGSGEVVDLSIEPGVEVALDFGPQTTHAARAFLHDPSGTPIAVLPLPPSGLVPLRLGPGEYVVEIEGASGARAITVTDESVVFELR
ncbi:MAG: hypothetical protein NTY35_15530 [Planctomycetota bacterium]|nr:hypothetical protein [Planctomycetota bacterium]